MESDPRSYLGMPAPRSPLEEVCDLVSEDLHIGHSDAALDTVGGV